MRFIVPTSIGSGIHCYLATIFSVSKVKNSPLPYALDFIPGNLAGLVLSATVFVVFSNTSHLAPNGKGPVDFVATRFRLSDTGRPVNTSIGE